MRGKMEYEIILLFFVIGLFSGFFSISNKIIHIFPIIAVFNIILYEIYLIYILNVKGSSNLPIENMLGFILIDAVATVLITAIGFSIGLFLKIAKGKSYGR
ncbi:conserved hypothetical protein [Methanococcus vannielii SB]|jgi:hypothetical protein|uniref:Uncharacterized protein n=1 Tax=Methanococcus vannielii (strain ATCC 35089 / DSM 1224 / JCM 13029 / OCM 148 / SB) TaxID=406327 RepID=A6UQR1_METVS|nr:hypothetical protein [Methanococcus vannielii]ABR54833.1 conserved hypothetical protein [Methanococcus vannielii SB]